MVFNLTVPDPHGDWKGNVAGKAISDVIYPFNVKQSCAKSQWPERCVLTFDCHGQAGFTMVKYCILIQVT